MRIMIGWVLGALLVGYLGRKRRAGFWGSFFFSLLFTPIVGVLALVLAAPSRQQKEAQKRAVRVAAAAASGNTTAVRQTRFALFSAFVLPWLVLVAVCAAIYAFTVDPNSGVNWERGFQLSLDMGTLGLAGSAGAGVTGLVRTVMALERLAVLVLLGTAVARVVGLRADSRLKQVRSSFDDTLSSLEEANRTQQAELARLNAILAQAQAPRPEPVVTTSATVSH